MAYGHGGRKEGYYAEERIRRRIPEGQARLRALRREGTCNCFYSKGQRSLSIFQEREK
jgi:hypothetical protein